MRPRHRWAVTLAACCTMLATAPILAGDPFIYSVPLDGFHEEVWREPVSLYRLTSQGETLSLPDTPFQRVTSRALRAGTTVMTVRCGPPAASPPFPPGPTADDLSDTPYLNLRDPAITAAAASLAGAADPVAAVAAFVHGHINRKMLGIPLVPAREIMRTKSGDCTEHAVLAAALLRSLGIPARAMAGMVLAPSFGGERNVFVFHLWVEAYHERTWRLVDATVRGTIHPNRYIALAPHTLRTAMPRAYFKAVSAVSGMRAELLPAPR